MTDHDLKPTPDLAEANAFFPSPDSLSKFTSPKSDLSGADYPNAYTGGRWKVLVIASDERYVPTENGTLFSSGNHPIETLLPMYHMDQAGFSFDIATLSGNMVKFEHWAMPAEDEAVMGFYAKYLDQFRTPMKLSDVIEQALGEDSDYIGVFIPGGHAPLVRIPESEDVKTVLEWAADNDKFIISLCHGPVALLALGKNHPKFTGYKICAFPDAIDEQTPEMGYMPGKLTWKFGESLRAAGFDIVNSDMSGAVYQDRKLLTGDSPLAANPLGKLAATALLEHIGN
ncbi:protein deglycase HchA [Halomonas sp. XH26]|uniref:glyoxalase III HchA n=1 Tax=Halomonas sp. XH26 TaxID=2557993 RepID=UPI00209E4410|nr:glyoxalase III HchA [Halomonas sp. XH26]UTA81227.1 protein deglycase HchA [Halomonas sp. XH26]